MPPALDESRLAHAAAGGDGAAFAQLYEAYEARVFTFCQRLVGTPEDAADATQEAFVKVLQRLPGLQGRELNFGAYLYTAARNASYDVIGRRKRLDLVDEGSGAGFEAATPVHADERAQAYEDPEKAAMIGTLQSQVQAANQRLPERHREVLVLREVDELSYDEIAEIMDMNRNSVAQLISRARIRLRDELRGSALASVANASADCERALPLIAARQDGQLRSEDDREWLKAHLAACATCPVSVDAMEEAGLSYRAWVPLVPMAWLWKSTMARAAELTGSDWSEVIERGPQRRGDGGGGVPGGGGRPEAAAAAGGARDPETMAAAGDGGSRRGRAVAGVLGSLLLSLLLITLVAGDDAPPADPTGDAAPAAVTTTPAATTAGAAATTTGGKPARRTRRKRDPATVTTFTTATVTTPEGRTVTVRKPVVRRKEAPADRQARRDTVTGSAPQPDPPAIAPAAPAPPQATQETPPAPPGTTTTQEPPPTQTAPPTRTTAPPTTTTAPPSRDCSRDPASCRDGTCTDDPYDPDCRAPRSTAPPTGSTPGRP